MLILEEEHWWQIQRGNDEEGSDAENQDGATTFKFLRSFLIKKKQGIGKWGL